MSEPLLTDDERHLIQTLSVVYTTFERVTGYSPVTRDDDLREVRLHIHALQRMAMAQAAARAFPEEARSLGGTVQHVARQRGTT